MEFPGEEVAHHHGGKEKLLSAVLSLSMELEEMVENGRKSYEATCDINTFVQSHGPEDMHGLLTVYPVQNYAKCYNSAGVKSRKELEEVWSSYFSDGEVRDTIERLLATEEAYKKFMDDLDKEMELHEKKTATPVAFVGKCLPKDLTLVESRSGETTDLESLLKKNNLTLFVLRKHYV